MKVASQSQLHECAQLDLKQWEEVEHEWDHKIQEMAFFWADSICMVPLANENEDNYLLRRDLPRASRVRHSLSTSSGDDCEVHGLDGVDVAKSSAAQTLFQKSLVAKQVLLAGEFAALILCMKWYLIFCLV